MVFLLFHPWREALGSSAAVFSACRERDYAEAERVRARFLEFEDLRDCSAPGIGTCRHR